MFLRGQTKVNERLLVSILATVLSVWFAASGCKPQISEQGPQNSEVTTNPNPLSVLVINDEEFAERLERLWNAQSESKIRAEVLSEEDFSSDWNQISKYDLAVYPSQYLGELASRDLLLKINPRLLEDDNYGAADIMPHDREKLTVWGRDTVAVSLGHRPWVLMIREDIFEAAGLETPETWEEYSEVCQRLESPPELPEIDAENWTPTTEPTATDWLDDLLFARSGSYISHRGSFCPLFDLRKGIPLVNNSAYEKGLQELVRHQYSEILGDRLSPESGWERLLKGQCAMAIGWPAPEVADAASNAVIRVAPLPGSTSVFISTSDAWRERADEESIHIPYYGQPGRLISVTEASRRSGSSWGLVSWLSQKKNQQQICSTLSSAFPTRYSLLSQSGRWLGSELSTQSVQDLTAVVRAYQDEFVIMTPPRISGSAELLRPVENAVLDAKAGKTPAEALSGVQKAWTTQLESRREEGFIRELELSLGL